jgi:hypothetical protein
MGSIKILDTLGVELLSSNPVAVSGLGKYLKGTPAQLLAGVDLAGQFRKDLTEAAPGDSGFGLKFQGPVGLGGLRIEGGAQAIVGIFNRKGMRLFGQTYLGKPVTVGSGQAYVSFGFRTSLGGSSSSSSGNLTFGFGAGTEADIRCYRPFDITGDQVNTGEACKALLDDFVLLGDASDLEAMRTLPTGTLAAASGKGRLGLAATLDMAAAFAPTAALGSIPKVGKLSVDAGASLKVGASVQVSGEYEIRVQRLDGPLVRLSYHKGHGSEFGFTVSGSAGPGVDVGDKDLLQMMFGKDANASTASETDLVAGGISRKQLESIRTAMRAGMSRKLNVEFAAAFSLLKKEDAAFEYEIDLDELDAHGRAALDKALAGDLTDLNAMESSAAHGIRTTQSVLTTLRKKTVRWRINLLGLVNVLSVVELAKSGTVFFDDESGELTITDEVTLKRIGAVTNRSEIRKARYESAMLTATYKAAGVDVNAKFNASQSFFLLDRHANKQRMSDFLDAVSGAGLLDADDIDDMVADVDDFGTASLLLESEFNQDACERLFLANDGGPHPYEYYEDAGKQALLALVAERDPDAYRRIPLQRAPLWKRMRDQGPNSLDLVLPKPITGGASEAIRVAVVRADYLTVVWWAKTMAEAAERVSDMRRFLAGRDATGLAKDKAFKEKRDDLVEAMSDALLKNRSSFDDPWGLLALLVASGGSGETTALVASPKLTVSLPA